MVNRRAPRRRANAPRAPVLRALTRRENRRDTGVGYKPSPTPPKWTAAPWWPLTVVTVQKEAYTFTVKDVAYLIRQSLGWDGYVDSKEVPLPVDFRVQNVRIYGTKSQPIQLEAYELLGGKHITKEQSDFGGKFTYSSLGFRWGTQSKIDVLNDSDKMGPDNNAPQTLFYVNGFADEGKIIVYVQVLLKAKDAPTPSLISGNSGAHTLEAMMNDTRV